jgi:hypothetical protein
LFTGLLQGLGTSGVDSLILYLPLMPLVSIYLAFKSLVASYNLVLNYVCPYGELWLFGTW